MAEEAELIPKNVYDEGVSTRSAYEDRAEALSKLTIPFLFPSSGATGADKLRDSYAARYASIAVNGLASQMVLTLLPASGSSFRFDPDADAMMALSEGDAEARATMMAMINKETHKVNKEIENQSIRPKFYEFMQTMVAVSPIIVEKVEKKGIKWHNLRNFVVKLNDMGEPLQMCIKQELSKHNLPGGVEIPADDDSDTVELYTLCNYMEDKWTVTRSINETIVGNEKTYSENELPYVYLGWLRSPTDTYHRPYAEQYQGILEDYADMNKVSVDGALISSKTIPLVNPLGVTRKEDLAKAVNGEPIDGREEDIGSFKVNKNYDFQNASNEKQTLMQQIDEAFLKRVQRQAERVTAEEIRQDAAELEKNLVGMYSIMSKKFSKWLIIQIMKELNIKFDTIDVNVITGLDALGKNIEAQQLDGFVSRLTSLELKHWLKEPELINRYAAMNGIDIEGLIKTPKEVQAEQQAAQQAQQQQMVAESMAQAGGQVAGQRAAMPQE